MNSLTKDNLNSTTYKYEDIENMKVSFFHYFPLGMWTQTGDMRFLEKLKEHLEYLNVKVELFDIWSKQHDYNIIHLFGYTHELASFAEIAKKFGIRVVWSTIATNSMPAWMWKSWGLLDKYIPTVTTYQNLQRLFKVCDVILPGSNTELLYLHDAFGVSKDKMSVINYAVEKKLASLSADNFIQEYKIKDFVLMVGRISKRKGQLKVIKALENLDIQLVFIGYPAPYEPDYCDQFFKECEKKSWVHYLGVIPDEILYSAYKAAKVHVLPSINECPGITSLEAGMAGTEVVAVKDPAIYDYLADEAYYCKPNSVESIRKAILNAYKSTSNKNLQSRLINEFSWEVTGMKVLNIYQNLLKDS